ncbi:MAG: XdhC family protein [Bacteroidia bacterium]|nr:XdhC family protein [Bacteroidia bacterium]
MKQHEALLAAYEQARSAGIPCVLATVVHVEGSAYRQAGARMLVDLHGNMTGAISGGCLEGDALRKALHALEQGQNKLVTYDTSDEDDAIVGAQLGCNGVIQVLFEPIFSDQPDHPVELLQKAADSGEHQVLTCLFHLSKTLPQPGTRILFGASGQMQGEWGDQRLLHRLRTDAQEVLDQQYSQFVRYQTDGPEIRAFLEWIAPPPLLALIGAGNDAQVLAQMAGLLGWDVCVADGRPSHANTGRFAGACQVIVSKPEQVLEQIPRRTRRAFVLMTHNYPYDLALLRRLLSEPDAAYIGLLGPRKKYLRMLDELAAEGIRLTEEQHARIYAPVGLALGAETPAEIALSILAEIQAVLAQTPAGHLRERQGPIHDPQRLTFKDVQL